ncbi:MAG: hypothetical protein H6799_03440 [Candidatus Nomurabacteria bacterium]|nr:MAG: hypothetical protein H6799_03440 [Candidatus Nomurabacteria bacterium]HRV76006.1 hypothetical protein [Candidatus Saccharimonadales bacterium]
MGELIRIGAEDFRKGLGALVDPAGAHVAELTLNGMNVFYPKQVVDVDGAQKTRGGMHLCSPYFGLPDSMKALGQPQHGYARDVEWEVNAESSSSVSLSHVQTEGPFSGLVQQIEYKILQAGDKRFDATLCAMLSLRNTRSRAGDIPKSDRDIIVAPGFHPYFDELFDQTLHMNTPRRSDTARRMGISAIQTIRTQSDLEVVILTSGLPNLIEWTDGAGRYSCVEPTCAGESLDTFEGAYIIKPGFQKDFAVEIAVRRDDTNLFML